MHKKEFNIVADDYKMIFVMVYCGLTTFVYLHDM